MSTCLAKFLRVGRDRARPGGEPLWRVPQDPVVFLRKRKETPNCVNKRLPGIIRRLPRASLLTGTKTVDSEAVDKYSALGSCREPLAITR
jgi:hypothetical protein